MSSLEEVLISKMAEKLERTEAYFIKRCYLQGATLTAGKRSPGLLSVVAKIRASLDKQLLFWYDRGTYRRRPALVEP